MTRPSLRAERAGADPHELAGGAELVEHARVVVERSRAGRIRASSSENGSATPSSRTIASRSATATAARLIEAVPARQERGVASRRRPARPARAASRACGGAAGAGPPDRSCRVAVPPGRSSPRTSWPRASSSASTGSIDAAAMPQRAAGPGGGERRVRARVARDQRARAARGRVEERGRQALRQRDAERVAVARGIFGGDAARRVRARDRRERRELAIERSTAGAGVKRPDRTSTSGRLAARGESRCCDRGRRRGAADRSRASSSVSAPARSSARSCCSSASTSASTSGSSRSRSSPPPISSRSRSRSSVSACALRSASGASPSYRNAAT